MLRSNGVNVAEAPPKPATIEKYLGWGWYQALQYLIVQWMIITEIVNMEFMSYGKAQPGGVCISSTTGEHLEYPDSKDFCRAWKEENCTFVEYLSDFNSISADVRLTHF